jgi:CRP/FNR family cyclic AMP-dependent transcriptional regulator
MHDITDLLINNPLFAEMNISEIRMLSKLFGVADLREGKHLFREGQAGDFVGFIISGKLEVLKKGADGAEVAIATIGKNQSVGEMSIVDHFPRSASARVIEEARILVLRHESFDRMVEEYPRLAVKLLKTLSRLMSLQLRRTSGNLVEEILLHPGV